MLTITHNSGFFSNCSVRLHRIIEFLNEHKKLPNVVDSSQQFGRYKTDDQENKDITYEYFEKKDDLDIVYTDDINFHNTHQYLQYKTIKHNVLKPFIEKYFSPTKDIRDIIENMEKKYNINYNNLCVLFYRGNDKSTETRLAPYNLMLSKSEEIKKRNPGIKFLIQSDETEFINFALKYYPKAIFFKNEIRHMKKCKSSVDLRLPNQFEFSKKFLAITNIMAKCKYVVCNHSGNCSLWIYLYRGDTKNFFQYHGKKMV